MLTVRFELDDPRLCQGCPFNRDEVDCRAGFARTTAALAMEESRGMWMSFFGAVNEVSGKSMRYMPARPLACVLATEGPEAVHRLPTKKKKAPKRAAKNGLYYVRCINCGKLHWTNESCAAAADEGEVSDTFTGSDDEDED